MSERTLRLFFAVELPAQAHGPVDACAQLLSGRTKERVRWLGPTSHHVTLHFLGGAPQTVVPSLQELLKQATLDRRRIAFRFEPPTAFPNTRRARVLVLPIGDASGELSSLARAIQEGAAPLGFPAEMRPYRPHVTLARLKPPRDVRTWLVEPAPTSEPLLLERVTLYHSELTPHGSRYQALATADLLPF